MTLRHLVAAALAAAALSAFAPVASADPLYCVDIPREEVLYLATRPMTICVLGE